MRTKHEDGFSLIELMVAMVVTLMVTGAVYGLLTGGQNAFRREPGLSDRQQNIRSAMDLIMRDIGSAGAGMPDFIQTFTPGLNGPTSGCTDNSGASVTCPTGSSGAPADELEIMANPNDLAAESACGYQGGGQSHTFMRAGKTNVQDGQVVMIILRDGTWTMRNIVDSTGINRNGSDICQSNVDHADLSFNPGSGDRTGLNQSSGLCAGNPVTDAGGSCIGCTGNGVTGTSCCSTDCKAGAVLGGEIVRYRIRLGSDGVPNLERFSSSFATTGFNSTGVRQFQVIARGIEDLQVRYTAASQVQTDNAPVVDQTKKDYGSLVQRVTVTLSARSEVQNVAGMQSAAGGQPNAMRGTLTSDGSPRAVLTVLGRPQGERATGWYGPTWN